MQGKSVRIVGVGKTALGRLGKDSATLATEALGHALRDAKMELSHLQGLVAVPSLSNPHFMQAHYLATVSGLNRINKKLVVRTIDTGGAGPISAIAVAVNMIRMEWAEAVAIVASDSVLSLPSKEFSTRADMSVEGADLRSPRIPHGYDTYAQWQMKWYGVTREQLAMVPVLMSVMASNHPDALCRTPYSLKEVLESRPVAPVTNLLECARRADGAVALVLASERHYKRSNFGKTLDHTCPVIAGVGEASGPLFPPPNLDDIHPGDFSCERAAKFAYRSAQLGPRDIDFFGLYDCFPICFIRALEAVGVCKDGQGGRYVEDAYRRYMSTGKLDPSTFPINTHGGLQCFGAPWEVPAMYNVVEAVAQLSGSAGQRQIHPKPKRALVYGNGGIFSASSVAILGDGVY